MDFSGMPPEDCARRIRDAGHISVLTGAGISTAAGVPDFRGPKGLYVTRAYDPETVFEIGYFERHPEPFYAFSRDFLGLLDTLEPTFTHRFLAGLESAGRDVGVVTQNIDGLHQRAGSRRVYSMHGDYETARCLHCRRRMDGAALTALMAEMEVPACPECGGLVKPDVVFFGEPVRHLDDARRLVAASDLLLVLGTSLVVYPAAALPACAGGEVVIVNKGDIALEHARSGSGTYLVDAALDEYFAKVAERL